jgi:hypothetical protein
LSFVPTSVHPRRQGRAAVKVLVGEVRGLGKRLLAVQGVRG